MPPVSAVPDDEIYDRYLRKAIAEINELGHEIAIAAGAERTPVLGSGHPLADVFMMKWSPQRAEEQEGVAFFGRSGQAIIRSLNRLRVDPTEIYGTNCLKFGDAEEGEARAWLTRELHIVQPKLLIVMGEPALAFLKSLDFPLANELEDQPGQLQRFTATMQALTTPDVDESLDEAPAKTRFWNAFKALGPWWAELPPY